MKTAGDAKDAEELKILELSRGITDASRSQNQ